MSLCQHNFNLIMTQDGFNEHHSDHRIEFALTQARKMRNSAF